MTELKYYKLSKEYETITKENFPDDAVIQNYFELSDYIGERKLVVFEEDNNPFEELLKLATCEESASMQPCFYQWKSRIGNHKVVIEDECGSMCVYSGVSLLKEKIEGYKFVEIEGQEVDL